MSDNTEPVTTTVNYIQQLKDLSAKFPKNESTCPACGYCPHCGRSNGYQQFPLYPSPYYPPYTWGTITVGNGNLPQPSGYTLTLNEGQSNG